MKDSKFTDEDVQNFFDNYYVDRGMAKWQGFFLSDHTSKLKEDSKAKNEFLNKTIAPQMEIYEIEKTIGMAITKHSSVTIQLNEIDANGNFVDTISGSIIGYDGGKIYINDPKTQVLVESIRSIK